MCDYSLQAAKTRPAKVNDELTVRQLGWSTKGFAASEDRNVAVCLLPGTELSFAEEVRKVSSIPWLKRVVGHKTAIFRKINQNRPTVHHDALEFPDGQIVLLTFLARASKRLFCNCLSPTLVPKRPNNMANRPPSRHTLALPSLVSFCWPRKNGC